MKTRNIITKTIVLIVIFTSIIIIGCKKTPSEDIAGFNNAPVTSLNGWSYVGKAPIKNVPGADSDYQLYLAKVYEHGSSIIDVFYGVKYKMLNYYGGGNGIFIEGDRVLFKSDGSVLRRSTHEQNDFESLSKRLFVEVDYVPSNGNPFVVDYIFPIEVEVLGYGVGEFNVFSPAYLFSNFSYSSGYFTSKIEGGYIFHSYYAAGSSSPRTILSSPVCKLLTDNHLVQTQQFWGAANIAIGKNTQNNQYFVFTYLKDSVSIMVSAVTPQSLYSNMFGSYYELAKQIQPMFAKKIKDIIPQWDNTAKLNIFPAYFQYPTQPNELYIILLNNTQLFVVSFNLNTFNFQVKASYSNPSQFIYNNGYSYPDRDKNNIQFIDNQPGVFLFTEKRENMFYSAILKNGTINTLNYPTFNSDVRQEIMDIRYDNGKLWMIVLDKENNFHLFSKNL